MGRKYVSRNSIAEVPTITISPHVSKVIREQIISEFGLREPLKKKDIWNLKHCSSLIQERGDVKRVGELIDLFRISKPERFLGIDKFYWWYRDIEFSKNDIKVYQVFDAISEELKLNQCDPSKFAGLCDTLIERLEKFKGKASNTIESLLVDYFRFSLPKAVKFNPTLATSPKSLLSNFGWDLWIEQLSCKYGGKLQYLNANKEELSISKEQATKLKELQNIKNLALQDLDILRYDAIGISVTADGIDVAYAKFNKGKVV